MIVKAELNTDNDMITLKLMVKSDVKRQKILELLKDKQIKIFV